MSEKKWTVRWKPSDSGPKFIDSDGKELSCRQAADLLNALETELAQIKEDRDALKIENLEWLTENDALRFDKHALESANAALKLRAEEAEGNLRAFQEKYEDKNPQWFIDEDTRR